jgi:hypothetical protein
MESSMKSIWYLVGLVLVVIGALVSLGGVIEPRPITRLGELRPALWWGAVVFVSGVLFLWTDRRRNRG